MPSHRSYLDFILVSYVMLEHNLPLPCIAAGLGKDRAAAVCTMLWGRKGEWGQTLKGKGFL